MLSAVDSNIICLNASPADSNIICLNVSTADSNYMFESYLLMIEIA